MNASADEVKSTGEAVVSSLGRFQYRSAVTLLREAFDSWDATTLEELFAHTLIPTLGLGNAAAWQSVAHAVEVEDSLYNLAVLYWHEPGREFEAIQIMRQSVAGGGDGAKVTLAEWLIWFGASEQAVRLLNEGFDESQPTARARGLLARALLDSGERLDDEMIEFLHNAAISDEEFRTDLIAALIGRGEYSDARVLLEADAAAGSAQAALKLGNLLADQLTEPLAAELAYRRAVDLGDANAAHNLGLHLAATGRRREALEFLELAVLRGDADAAADLDALRHGDP